MLIKYDDHTHIFWMDNETSMTINSKLGMDYGT